MENKVDALFGLLGTALLAAVMVMVFTPAARAELAVLEVTDCVKCHQDAPASIAGNGGRHGTEVTCLDCHQEHPPGARMSSPSAPCAMKASLILTWKTAWRATPIPMSRWP